MMKSTEQEATQHLKRYKFKIQLLLKLKNSKMIQFWVFKIDLINKICLK